MANYDNFTKNFLLNERDKVRAKMRTADTIDSYKKSQSEYETISKLITSVDNKKKQRN